MQADEEARMLQRCRIVMEQLSKGEPGLCVDERIREQLDSFADPRTPVAKLAEEVLASMQGRSNVDQAEENSADSEAPAGVASALPMPENIADVLGELREQASQLDLAAEQIKQLPNGRVLTYLCGRLEMSADDAYLCALVAAASVELLLFRSVRTSVGLLREIVELPQLKDALGPAVVAVMVYLLLPSGINLRNLVVRRRRLLCEWSEQLSDVVVVLVVLVVVSRGDSGMAF